MLPTKTKKYFLAPTYKQINSVLNKGYMLESVNSVPCMNEGIVSVENSEKYSFLFSQCQDNEEYCCLQYFIYYSLWSEEEYEQVMKGIEEYKEKGAYIISTYSVEVIDSLDSNASVPSVLSSFPEEKINTLYYIIIPKKYVTEQEENCSCDAMLKCLGAINYKYAYYGSYFLVGAILFALMAILKGSGYIFVCLLVGFLIYILGFFAYIRDVFIFSATVYTENNIPFDIF